jgi:murein DD-endopeptidase MepM/ murein hydrolase activator NlpD
MQLMVSLVRAAAVAAVISAFALPLATQPLRTRAVSNHLVGTHLVGTQSVGRQRVGTLSAARMAPTGMPAMSSAATPAAGSLPPADHATRSRATTGAHQRAPGTTWVTPRPGFGWPLSPRPAVHRRFEQPRSQWSGGHRGVDLAASVGQPVLSAGEGVVAFSGVVAGRGVVTVAHAGGLRTTYEPVEERPRTGVLVHRGAKVGVVAPAAGHCVPLACLHWGAITGTTYRDPLSLLGFGRPILLPLS